MEKINSIEIFCPKDNYWFPSPISFGDMDSFDSSTLIGNKFQCPECKRMIGCNKENMRVKSNNGGFRGIDT